MAVAGDLESMLSTVDYLEADRLEFYFKIAAHAGPEKLWSALVGF